MGDYIKFGDDLILNGTGAIGPTTAALYTVTRAEGLGALPTPRLVLSQVMGVPGAVLGEGDDDSRLIVLEGEIHVESHALLVEELERFKYLASVQRGAQWLYWTPEGQAARKIEAILQNNAGIVLDTEDDCTASFRMEMMCPDPYFRSTSDNSITGNITGTGQTVSLTNAGNVYAEPVIRIKPTAGKTGGYNYKRWLTVYNRTSYALNNYPLEISTQAGTGFNHAALVGAGHAQADGDDLRVQVDGAQVRRWLNGANTATCKVWANITFQAGQSAVLAETIGSGDTIASLTVDDISGFPVSGILYNPTNGEAFTYTGRDVSLNKFTGVTRAAKGTSAANNTAGQTLWWVEHDVWLLYGNSGATAQTVDDNYKPIFELGTSTNTSWVYQEFGENDGLRTGAWTKEAPPVFAGELYTANRHTDADPWEEVGIYLDYDHDEGAGRFKLYNPSGITNVNFTNGEKYQASVAAYWSYNEPGIESSVDGTTWVSEYVIPDPSAPATWESWSRSEALTAGSIWAALRLGVERPAGGVVCALEAADCTITLDGNHTPAIVLGAEQGNYTLAATLTTVVDGEDQEAIELSATLDLNQELEVDCAARTITYLADNSNQFQALELQSPELRAYWLKLRGHWDGGQTSQLRYDETGVAGVTLVVTFPDRYL